MAIDTREELINALHVACEVEHALLVQYLYTGLSLKKAEEGLTPRQQKLVREWQGTLFLVAREEMGHYAIACNLLSAIGAPPKFDRPAMPRQIGYYPFPFDLLPFGDEALHRFMVFELPRDHPPPPPPGANLRPSPLELEALALELAPEPITYEYVGELYAKIAGGFEEIAEDELFIGPPAAQTENDWSDEGLDIRTVTDRQSALDAIAEIVEDGEGTPEQRESSHFSRFEKIRLAYFDEGRFPAARAVPRNPATREDPRAGGPVTPIANEETKRAAELFNSAYGAMLLMLEHYFVSAPTSRAGAERRQALQLASQRLMSVAVRPLAEELTLMPLGDPAAPERAGPPFEIYSEIAVSPHEQARWTILLERLGGLAEECARIGSPRIAEIGESLAIMRSDLVAAVEGGG